MECIMVFLNFHTVDEQKNRKILLLSKMIYFCDKTRVFSVRVLKIDHYFLILIIIVNYVVLYYSVFMSNDEPFTRAPCPVLYMLMWSIDDSVSLSSKISNRLASGFFSNSFSTLLEMTGFER